MFRKDPFSSTGLARSGSANVFQLPGGRLGGGASLLGRATSAQPQQQPLDLTPAGEQPLANRQTMPTSTPIPSPSDMGPDGSPLTPQDMPAASPATPPMQPRPVQPPTNLQPAAPMPAVPPSPPPTLIDAAARNMPQPAPPAGPGPGGRRLAPAPISATVPEMPAAPPSPTINMPTPAPPVSNNPFDPGWQPSGSPAPQPSPAGAPRTSVPMTPPAPVAGPSPTATAVSAAPMVGSPPPVLTGKFQPHIDAQREYIAQQTQRLSDPALSPRQRRMIQETIKARRGYADRLAQRQTMSVADQIASAPTEAAKQRAFANNIAGGSAERYQRQANDYYRTGDTRPLASYGPGSAVKGAGYADELDDELRLVRRYTMLRRRPAVRRGKTLKDVASSESLLAIDKDAALTDLARGFIRTCLIQDHDLPEVLKTACHRFPELADDLAGVEKYAGFWDMFRRAGSAAENFMDLPGLRGTRPPGGVIKPVTNSMGDAAQAAGRAAEGTASGGGAAAAAGRAAAGGAESGDAARLVGAVDEVRQNTAGARPFARGSMPGSGGGGGGPNGPPPGAGGAHPQMPNINPHAAVPRPQPGAFGRMMSGAWQGLGLQNTFWPADMVVPGGFLTTMPLAAGAGAIRNSNWFKNLATRPGIAQRLAKGYDYLNPAGVQGDFYNPFKMSPEYGSLAGPQKALAQMNRVGALANTAMGGYGLAKNPVTMASIDQRDAAMSAGQPPPPDQTMGSYYGGMIADPALRAAGISGGVQEVKDTWADVQRMRQEGSQMLEQGKTLMTSAQQQMDEAKQLFEVAKQPLSWLSQTGLDKSYAEFMKAPDIMTGLMNGWNALSDSQKKWLITTVGGGMSLVAVLAGLAGGNNALTGIGATMGLGTAAYASGIIDQLMQMGQQQQGPPQEAQPALEPPAAPPTGATTFSTLPVTPGREFALASGRA